MFVNQIIKKFWPKVMFEAKLLAGKAPPVDKLVDETFDLDPYTYSSLKIMWSVTASV